MGIHFEELGGLDRKEGAMGGWRIKIRARGGKGLCSEIGNTGAHLYRLSPARNVRPSLTGREKDSHDALETISAQYPVLRSTGSWPS